MTRVAIIGFSGRNIDPNKLEPGHFTYIKDVILCTIEGDLGLNIKDVILVSGGSAWCDHAAIALALENDFKLVKLYLPCDISRYTGMFISNREAFILNNLHSTFNKIVGLDSVADFKKILSKKNTQVVVKNGFFGRNNLIADDCDYLIAVSIDKNFPTTGGTKYTWTKCTNAQKIHISLETY